MVAKKSAKKSTAKKPAENTAKVSQSEEQESVQGATQGQTKIIEPAGTYYQDGLAGVSLYQGVAKIDFYKVLGINPDGSEVRKISDRVVIPAGKLVEVEQALQQIAAALQNAQQQANSGS